MLQSVVGEITRSKAKTNIDCYDTNISDIMNFGFSYIEHEDHIVEYIVSNSTIMKKIFGEVNDSVLKPEGESIGELWTAKLLLSNKLKDKEIIFSNNIFSVVINLDLNPYLKE